MGNVQCSCSDIIKNILIDSSNLVDITKIPDNPNIITCLPKHSYDLTKIITIQSFYRMYIIYKPIKIFLKPKEKSDEDSKAFRVKSSKSKKSKKKKEKTKGSPKITTTNNSKSIPNGALKQGESQQKPTPENGNGDTPNEFSDCPNPFDPSLCPGKIIEIDSVILLPEVHKTEILLNEFIIEQKELLNYLGSFPYKLKEFQLVYPNGSKYSGYFNPLWSREGYGVLVNSDGSKYNGMFKRNYYDGRGRLIHSKGDYYEGEFAENKANGYGKYVSVDGEIYIGYWVNHIQHGRGELILKEGIRYEGIFENGIKNGQGRMFWPDTSYYEGGFVNNYFEGLGEYHTRNGKVYKGEWRKGKMEGVGIFKWPDGKRYIGMYYGDKRNGYGIYIDKDGVRYEGQFKNNKQHGIGMITNGNELQVNLYQKGRKIKWLNEADFKEDIEKIRKGVYEVSEEIANIDYFIEDAGEMEKDVFLTQFTTQQSGKKILTGMTGHKTYSTVISNN